MTATPTSRNRMGTLARREAWEGRIFVLPWVIGFVVFTVGPMLASLYFAFTDYSVLSSAKWVGLENFQRMFTGDRLFWLSLWNTAFFVLLSVPLNLTFAFFMAMLLNRDLPGTGFFRTLYYLPVILPAVANALVWTLLFSGDTGVVNAVMRWLGLPTVNWLFDPTITKLVFVIIGLWGVGGAAIIFLAGLRNIPESLYEAASLDGANALRQFRHITLPMMTPVIFFNLVLSIIATFQIFTGAYVITGGGPANATLFYVLYLYKNGFQFFKMGYASALAWILFLIIMIFTVLQLRMSKLWVFYEAE